MKLMTRALLAATALVALTGTAHATTTVSNAPTGGDIGSFGRSDSQTYGQVFRAPVNGKLLSFTFWLNGVVQNVQGGVGTWNGGLTYATGNGSPANLFLGGLFNTVNGANVISTGSGVNVTAGQNYVAYITAFGNAGPAGTTTMRLGTSNPDLGHFVWNNTSDPKGNASWNYFANFGNAQFEAVFGAVPEPTTWAMMILGFGVIGGAMRRRKAQVRTAVSFG